jgi:hypothetical protein
MISLIRSNRISCTLYLARVHMGRVARFLEYMFILAQSMHRSSILAKMELRTTNRLTGWLSG